MNSILKSAPNRYRRIKSTQWKNDAKQDEMQHTKGRVGDVLKEKWKNKVMHGST